MAGIIFTGDLQADWSNLAQCEKVSSQILRFAKKKKAQAVVFLGDLKERYNPVDVRVVNFVTKMIEDFRGQNQQVFVLMGNHDRVGMRSVSESWLPTLERAGACCCAKAQTLRIGRFALYMLPFRESVDEVKDGVDKLLRLRENDPNIDAIHVLCFHQGLKEANYRGGVPSRDVLSVEDLHPKEFQWVLGGHLHMHQKVKYRHVMYVGSPFATTWGEANEQKGFIHIG